MMFLASVLSTLLYGILLTGCCMTAAKYYAKAFQIGDKYNVMFAHYLRQCFVYIALMFWITAGYILFSIAAMDQWGLPL